MDPTKRVQSITVVPVVARLLLKLENPHPLPKFGNGIDEYQRGWDTKRNEDWDIAEKELKVIEDRYLRADLGDEWTRIMAEARKVGISTNA